jgi:hypothetical protein
MIVRTFAVLIGALGVVGVATAGSVTPINLTTSNVYSGTCTGFGCAPTVSATNVGGTFENTLFSTLDPASPPSPNSSPQNVNVGTGTVPFILGAQSGSPFDDEYGTANTANLDSTLVMDLGTCSGLGPNTQCGLFNVTDLYTMIEGNLENFGYQGVTITLNGVTSLGAAVTDVIDLTAGVDYRDTASNTAGGVTCTVANASTGDTSCSGSGSQADTAVVNGTDSNPGGTGGNSVTVYNNVFGAQTVGAINYYLDVQDINLGTNFAGDYLDSITIADTSPNGGKERMFLSGVSAGQALTATPEPDTIALFGIGLGLCAFWKVRIRRNNGSPRN